MYRKTSNRLSGTSTAMFLVLCGCLFLTSCSSGSAQGNTVPAVSPMVAVAKVQRRDLSRALAVTAEFRPFQEIDVHAKVAGYVKTIPVDVGDRVNAGQVLASLEIPELHDEVQQADAAVRQRGRDTSFRGRPATVSIGIRNDAFGFHTPNGRFRNAKRSRRAARN